MFSSPDFVVQTSLNYSTPVTQRNITQSNTQTQSNVKFDNKVSRQNFISGSFQYGYIGVNDDNAPAMIASDRLYNCDVRHLVTTCDDFIRRIKESTLFSPRLCMVDYRFGQPHVLVDFCIRLDFPDDQ